MSTYKIVSNGKRFKIKMFTDTDPPWIVENWYVGDYFPWWRWGGGSLDPNDFETGDLKFAYNLVRKLIQRDKFLALQESFNEKFKSTNPDNWVEL